MSALKNKLSQKIEAIEAEQITTDGSSNNETANPSLELQNNVIPFKNSGDVLIGSIVPSFAININEAKERLIMLQNFVKELMIPNVDYGLIPKSDKPCLFKPGAEKLCDIFGFSKQVEILNRIEYWEKGFFHYEVKVLLTNKRTGIIEAEGIGSCNNKERKFKNQDSFSITNTILKMSKKRAFIDAVLSATRSSGIFTQDIEEAEDINNNNFNSSNVKNPNVSKSNISSKAKPSPITRDQQSLIFVAASKNNIQLDYVKKLMIEKYNTSESKMLTTDQANELIMLLNNYAVI